MTNLDSIVKSRVITLLTKIHLVKAMISLLVKYGCDIWRIKKQTNKKQTKTNNNNLRAKELMLLNCRVGENPSESLGLQRDQASQS